MKYRPKIGTGDFDTKTRRVAKFLGDGHKVKITIMFRGREMSHPELGKRILDQVAETVGTLAKVEAAPKLDGRNMTMVLAPDRRAQQAAAKAARTQTTPDGTPPTEPGPEAASGESGPPADAAGTETASNGSRPTNETVTAGASRLAGGNAPPTQEEH